MMIFQTSSFGTCKVRKLQKDERVKSFNCGDDDLNDFILNKAILYRKSLLAVTYVFENIESKEVIGYFSLANDRVSLNDFDDKTGCRFITVDAYHDAIPFYKNNDFQYLRKDEYDIVTRLLYFDLNDIVEEIA